MPGTVPPDSGRTVPGTYRPIPAAWCQVCKDVQRLPVEVWFKSDKVVHTVKSDKEIVAVRLDPERMLPDNKRGNNSWKAED